MKNDGRTNDTAGTAKPNNDGRGKGSGRLHVLPPRNPVSWEEVSNQLLRDTVVAVTGSGAAIMLGRTTDGGALSITVLDGSNKVREWPHTVDEVESVLKWLVAMYADD